VWHVVGNEKQEHRDSDEDGYAERHLLTAVSRQQEDQQQDAGQQQAREDDVTCEDNVEI